MLPLLDEVVQHGKHKYAQITQISEFTYLHTALMGSSIVLRAIFFWMLVLCSC